MACWQPTVSNKAKSGDGTNGKRGGKSGSWSGRKGYRPPWRPRRKNHGNSEAAAGLADAALRRVIPDERIKATRVQLAWSRAIPLRVQKVAWPVSFAARDTLVLNVVDNQWLHELSYLRDDLLRRLRAACDGIKIADLRLRVGEVEVLPTPERPPPPLKAALSPEPQRSTIDAMESVTDPQLRQAIANARLALGQD